MNKRRLRNNGTRPKAFLGIGESAAILAAAGINAATQLAAAGINSASVKDSAKSQAQATLQSAQRQAEALKEQSQKSKELQQEYQEFTKEENAENRELQKDIQLQLQMLTGQQNINDRLEASKIKVKAGGKTRRLGLAQSLLRGGNMPFRVTDGGGVIPIGRTSEGFDLYEIFGNDHEHYHKTRGGKYKSGVGIRFADGNVIEGEGNQKKNGGELMLVTPDNAYFISKHSINGFNPAESVKSGLHPLQAFSIQEQEKDIMNMNDDGTKKARLGKRKCLLGGMPNLNNLNSAIAPRFDTDTVTSTATGVASQLEKRRLRCGGKARVKAIDGVQSNFKPTVWMDEFLNQKPNINTNGSSKSNKQSFWGKAGNFINKNADLIGAGISGLGNIGGALISASANKSAASTLADAYNQGASIMRDAYNSLTGIALSSINKDDYRAAHAMASLQAPVSFADSAISGVNRSLQRRLRNAGKYSASSAAAQQRMNEAEVDAQDMRNRIYSADQQQMQEIRKQNTQTLNDVSRMNAYLDTEANKQYNQDLMELKKYNNEIENSKILGAAGAESEGAINAAGAIAQGRTAAGQAWSNAVSNIGLTGANTLSSMAKRRADLENTMLGATTDAQINYIARNGNDQDKKARLEAVQAALDSGKLSSEDNAKYAYYKKLLERSLYA